MIVGIVAEGETDQAVTRPLRKRKQLEAARQHSASLDAFVVALDAACLALTPAPPSG